MIEELKSWFRDNESRLESNLVQVEVNQRDILPQAIKAVMETELYIASFIAWETGSFDVDVLSFSKGEPVFAQRYDFKSSKEMIAVLEEVYNKILNDSFGKRTDDNEDL